ncbi:MAG: fatty acid hydroxylase [Chromatiales bacterium 21-64-14]|nr:MAG: fatty acid hydroxylase [Chromatiales bacterium 21-64-14]
MGLGELTVAYLQYPAIQVYAALLVASAAVALLWGNLPPNVRGTRILAAAALGVVVYPLAWYLIHRFVLHGRFLYRSPWTAAMWKRVHFDHHQDPHDLRVLFGALHTTLPTVAGVTLPLGVLIGGVNGAAAAFTAGLATTIFYEYCHCIQHLHYTPRSGFLRRIKRLHLMHHFHNENANFGITNFLWDRVAGTYHNAACEIPRSATVFNLGYTGEECTRYPWVTQRFRAAERTGDPPAAPHAAGPDSGA